MSNEERKDKEQLISGKIIQCELQYLVKFYLVYLSSPSILQTQRGKILIRFLSRIRPINEDISKLYFTLTQKDHYRTLSTLISRELML